MRCLLLTITIILMSQLGFANSESEISVQRLETMPMAFTENLGQWNEQVSFRANAGGATMWFTGDGAVYQFTRSIDPEDQNPRSFNKDASVQNPFDFDREPKSYESISIKASFMGANPDPQMAGFEMMDYKCNYFIGNDPNKWHTDVPNYQAIVYKEIYSGIDLKYYGNGKQMEYDFIVSPGADFSQINIQYKGAKSISVNNSGELVVETEWGEVVEQRPVIYQMVNESRVPVAGEYSIKGNKLFGFELSSSYDPKLPLIIDPVLSYSTYLGGSGREYGNDIAVDGSGNAYVTGETSSTDFPATVGAYQTTNQGGYDVFVTKLNSSGSALVYSTYIGGSDSEKSNGIIIDGSGNAYITGQTSSTNYPITALAYQSDQPGSDAFVTKLNSSGNGLVYSTYLGGSGNETGHGIAVDPSGNAYITGNTVSSDFPTTTGAYQTTNQGNYDVFLTKLNSSGSALVYSSYLGGSSTDNSNGIAIDGSGNAYLTGKTHSTDFPLNGEYQAFLAGSIDAFVTKLNSSGSALVYSTYLGGSDQSIGNAIAVDGSGNAYITGYTNSTDFPTTVGVYQTIIKGVSDIFITKLNNSGNALVYSTYLGGSSSENSFGIAVDGSGNVYIAGLTASSDFPTTADAYQTLFLSGFEVVVTKLYRLGNALIYSTYLTGSNSDEANGIALDASDNAYIVGITGSADFPATTGAYQTTYNGGFQDAFVARIDDFDNYICGDANGDGKVNLGDAILLINYIFKGGSAPNPLEAGDANCDGSVNIGDAVYLINYIFKGGPAPCCP